MQTLCEHSSTPLGQQKWGNGWAQLYYWQPINQNWSIKSDTLSELTAWKRIQGITQSYLLNPPTLFQVAQKPLYSVFDWFILNAIQFCNGAAIHVQLVLEVLQVVINSCTICTHHANLQNLGQNKQIIPLDRTTIIFTIYRIGGLI